MLPGSKSLAALRSRSRSRSAAEARRAGRRNHRRNAAAFHDGGAAGIAFDRDGAVGLNEAARDLESAAVAEDHAAAAVRASDAEVDAVAGG